MPMTRLHTEADRESGLPDRLLQQPRIAGEVSDDESEFYADVRYAALETEAGEFRGYAKIVRDMTEQRRRRRRTERFVEKSGDLVAIVDRTGSITYASGSSNRVVGYDPDELVDENLFDYLYPGDHKNMMERFFAASKTRNPSSMRTVGLRRVMASGDRWSYGVETYSPTTSSTGCSCISATNRSKGYARRSETPFSGRGHIVLDASPRTLRSMGPDVSRCLEAENPAILHRINTRSPIRKEGQQYSW